MITAVWTKNSFWPFFSDVLYWLVTMETVVCSIMCVNNNKMFCTDRCFKIPQLPSYCTLIQDPQNQCCQLPYCQAPSTKHLVIVNTHNRTYHSFHSNQSVQNILLLLTHIIKHTSFHTNNCHWQTAVVKFIGILEKNGQKLFFVQTAVIIS
jgi:hypothetical protein